MLCGHAKTASGVRGQRLAADETTRDLAAFYRVDQSTIIRVNARHGGGEAAA